MAQTVKQVANDVVDGRMTAEEAVPIIHDLMFPKGGKYVLGAGRGKDPDEVWESMAEGDTSERADNSFDEVSLLHNVGELSKEQFKVLLNALNP